MQFVALRLRLLRQLTPLLPQRARPLLHGVLVGLIRFGHQILTTRQNPLVLGLLGLELRLQNLSTVDPNAQSHPLIKTRQPVMDASRVSATPRVAGAAGSGGHLVLLVVQLDVVEVSSQSSLQPQPALIEPGVQLLAVVDELKHPELSLQLLPPENTAAQEEKREGGKVPRVSLCLLAECREADLLLQRDTSDLYCVSRALTLLWIW